MTPRGAFADQARACRALGSPLTADILSLIGTNLAEDQGAVAHRILHWPGDSSSRGDSVPLRLAGALRAVALSGKDPELAAAYDSHHLPWTLLLAVMQRHEGQILDWLDRAPQTNEVGRSACLIAAAQYLHHLTGQQHDFSLFELGCSAGLNLNFPLYQLEIAQKRYGDLRSALVLRPQWQGEALPDGPAPKVVAAEGVDLAPLNAQTDSLRLLAYLWPDQADRLARMQAALTIALTHPPQTVQGDAADWLEVQLAKPAPPGLRLVYHTIAWQYFPTAVQNRCEAALVAAGALASKAQPLAHLSMEADGQAEPSNPGAALQMRLWQGGPVQRYTLGRVDFHGRWIHWQPKPHSGLVAQHTA